MKVKIENFRCHTFFECTFEANKIILLKGCSGIGKSTIFEAIKWCLYGSMRAVYPNKNSNVKTVVTLEMTIPDSSKIISDLTIVRQTRPSLLKLYDNVSPEAEPYLDDVAQSLIDRIFGNKNFWS